MLALELRNRLEASLDLALSPTVIWRHPTSRSLSEHLLDLLARQFDERPVIPAVVESLTPAPAHEEVAGIASFLAEFAALAHGDPDPRTDR